MNKEEKIVIDCLIKDSVARLADVLHSDEINEMINGHAIDIYTWLNIKHMIMDLYCKNLRDYTNNIKKNLKEYLEEEC